jgi:hypothetical protein
MTHIMAVRIAHDDRSLKSPFPDIRHSRDPAANRGWRWRVTALHACIGSVEPAGSSARVKDHYVRGLSNHHLHGPALAVRTQTKVY